MVILIISTLQISVRNFELEFYLYQHSASFQLELSILKDIYLDSK